MGNILTRKRGNVWEYSFEIESDGRKRKRISKSGFATKSLALSAGTKAKSEYQSSKITFKPKSIIFGVFVKEWWELNIEKFLKPMTKQNYRYALNSRILPYFGDKKLDSISKTDISKYLNIESNNHTRNSLKLDAVILRKIFQSAYEDFSYLNQNPIPKIDLPICKESYSIKREILSPAELEERIQPLNEHYKFICMLLFYTGLRIGEAFALTWADIDLNEKYVQINKTQIREKSLVKEINSPKTKTSNRLVYFGDTLKNLLEYKKLHTNHFYYKKENDVYYPTKEKTNIEFVCANSEGVPLVLHIFSIALKKIGINAHSLRHSYTSLLINGGANIKSVQEQLGHSNPNVTLGVYTHTNDEINKQTINILENCLHKK